MKWTKEKIDEVTNLIKIGKNYHQVSEKTGIEYNAIRIKMSRLGEGFKKHNPKTIKRCVECTTEIKNNGIKFCSSSCSAKHNNKLRPKKLTSKNVNEKRNKKSRENYHLRKKNLCVNCASLTTRTYCNNKCQNEYRFKLLSQRIENGDTSIAIRRVKKYLIAKHGEKCMVCGWNKINPVTNKVPIEVEHIDGNSENNKLNNLKLLCPNCHSLTPTYKALNKGKGRHKRRERYKEGKSF